MFKFMLVAAVAAIVVQASPSPTVRDPYVRLDDEAPKFVKRAASCSFPSPPRTSSLPAPIRVNGTFDGGNVRFDRGIGACQWDEIGDAAAVFIVQAGGTLQNVVIGANQLEGVHCLGPCNLYNVWFEDTCEDAITIRQTSGTSNIVGGGARAGSDKLVQHSGGGHVNIDQYCAQNSGKLYRACGNCSQSYKRTVTISNFIASNISVLAGVNSNWGDVATIYFGGSSMTSVKSRCDTYKGVPKGSEAPKLTSDQANDSCVFK